MGKGNKGGRGNPGSASTKSNLCLAATVDCILAAVSRQQAEEGGGNLNKGRRRVGRT